MTQQYIIGQFSALLGDLQLPPGECLAETVHDLRREAESCPLARLSKLAREAMNLTDGSAGPLSNGEIRAASGRYAKVAVALAISDSAGLLHESTPKLRNS